MCICGLLRAHCAQRAMEIVPRLQERHGMQINVQPQDMRFCRREGEDQQMVGRAG